VTRANTSSDGNEKPPKQKASFLRMPYVNLTKIYEKMRYSYSTNMTRILVNTMKQSLKIVKTIKLIVKTLIT